MAKPSILVLPLFILQALLIAMANGDATAAPTAICNVKVSELALCIPAITGKSPKWPTKSCCSVMRKANLRCLCNYKGELAKFGVKPTKAAAVPKKCGLKLPEECKKKNTH